MLSKEYVVRGPFYDFYNIFYSRSSTANGVWIFQGSTFYLSGAFEQVYKTMSLVHSRFPI